MPLLGLYRETISEAADRTRQDQAWREAEETVRLVCARREQGQEEAGTDGVWETVRVAADSLDELDALILYAQESDRAFLEAEQIWEQRKELPVIFVANSPEEVFAALSYPFFHVARGYALEQDLEAALCKLERIRKPVGAGMRSFVCRSVMGAGQEAETTTRVFLRDILYIESRRHEIWVHCRSEVFVTDQTLSYWEEVLKRAGFVRVHKSFLVNLYHVQRLGRENVRLDSGDELLVSRYRYPEVKIRFEDYLRRAEFF